MESDCTFVDKWNKCLQSNRGVSKVKNWKKGLEDLSKYENVINHGGNLYVE